MKTLIILGFALLIALNVQGQTSVRTSSETVGFWTLSPDTMLIKKSDKVIHGSVYVPSTSAASAVITGCTFTVNGIVTNGITIPPGEAAVDFGFDYALMDSVRIRTTGTAWVMLMIKRD
jgi:hypothetical protein